jgi:uncharacterized protein YjdB
MKKIYFLSLLCCISVAAYSQTAVTLWANGAGGTYKTGNSTSTTRTDNTIVSTAATQGGYAVFDLSTIPAGSMINTCTIGFYTTTYGGSGVPSGWNTYGYAGDLSTLTTAATLFPALTSGTSVSTATYGTVTGNQTIATTAALTTFLNAHIGSKVSICFTGGAARVYTISGETGSTATITTANHAPYLAINYCPAPTVLTASAAPNPLCVGATLNLTGTGAGTGTLTWAWTGPGGYTSTMIDPSFTTSVTSAGVYTLTVTNTCASGAGTGSAVSPVVTLNPLPVITGGPGVCTGSNFTLGTVPSGGTFTSSTPGTATVGGTTGLVTGVSAGTTTITYTDLLSCVNTLMITDNDPPGSISGGSSVCIGNTISLTDPSSGGTWTSTDGTIAPVTGSGIVSGLASGSVTISYTMAGCPPVTQAVTVNALPSAITGPTNQICVGSSITLSDPDAGGTWSSSNITIATTGSAGAVNGVAPGSLNIVYTDPGTSCQALYPITVNALPAAIGGVSSVCIGSTITLSDATTGGLFSGSGTYATIAGAVVTGVAAGLADFTYTMPASGCDVTTTISVNPLPAAINTGAGIVCQGVSIPYTDTDPGGTWSSGSTAIATVGIVSGNVSGTGPGITSIIYTLPTGCSINAPVTVQVAPVSVITASGPTTFCAGGNVVLNGSAGAGYSYQWNLGGVPIAGATSAAYNASLTGPYTLSITNALSCVTTSTAVNVVDGITGTIINATSLSFCSGQYVRLYASTGGVTGTITYQWQLDSVSIGGATDSAYNAVATGEYICKITISGGAGSCPVVSNSVAVTVHTPPTPSVSYNGSVLSTAAGFAGYQWYENTVSVPGAHSNIYSPGSNGSYKVLVTDGNGCSGFSNAFALTGVGVGMVNYPTDIIISPNPVSTMLHIETGIPLKIVITGLEGKVYYEQADSRDINVSSLPNGMYIITAYDDNGNRVAVKKFVKE